MTVIAIGCVRTTFPITILLLVGSMLSSASVSAQTAVPRAPAAFVGCYKITLGAWSRTVNAPEFHAVPTTIRLDTAAASRGGWMVSPDIAYPIPSRLRGTPVWTVAQDTVEIVWSNGFQATTLRLGRHGDWELRGRGGIWSDANEYGTNLPRADVVAERVVCAPSR
jgi:hypothetical protein